MNFFKSVFSDDPTPPDSPTSPPPPQDPNPAENPAWSFGGLIKSLATKSESVIETYRRDLEELGSGLRKETAVIREAASRAVRDLPSSLEAGASVAQESLETVGKAVDDIGDSVWKSTAQIVSLGRDSILAPDHDPDYESNSLNYDNSSDNYNNSIGKPQSLDVKRYSRFDMQVRALQCNWDTYCTEPEDAVEYEEWRTGCFVLEERREEIESLMDENAVIREIYNEVVPSKIDEEGFWSRYFYKVHKLKQAEEARAMLVKRAIAGEEEDDLSWDFDDDNGDDRDLGDKEEQKGESSGIVELEKKSSDNSNNGMNNAVKNVVQEEKIGNLSDAISENYDKLEERREENAVVVVEGEGDNGGSCKDSDMSVVSSQSLLPEEEDLGWDEIENIGSNDENKGEVVGNARSTNRVDWRKRLSAAEEEDLSWDIEDEDDVPVKP